MKKRVPALVLALALALTVPAWAAQDTPDNFVRSKTYAGQFSDLTPESTFYDNVAALYAYGLSVGKADGTFGLRDQLTVGQVVIFAGRIRSESESDGTRSAGRHIADILRGLRGGDAVTLDGRFDIGYIPPCPCSRIPWKWWIPRPH